MEDRFPRGTRLEKQNEPKVGTGCRCQRVVEVVVRIFGQSLGYGCETVFVKNYCKVSFSLPRTLSL